MQKPSGGLNGDRGHSHHEGKGPVLLQLIQKISDQHADIFKLYEDDINDIKYRKREHTVSFFTS